MSLSSSFIFVEPECDSRKVRAPRAPEANCVHAVRGTPPSASCTDARSVQPGPRLALVRGEPRPMSHLESNVRHPRGRRYRAYHLHKGGDHLARSCSECEPNWPSVIRARARSRLRNEARSPSAPDWRPARTSAASSFLFYSSRVNSEAKLRSTVTAGRGRWCRSKAAFPFGSRSSGQGVHVYGMALPDPISIVGGPSCNPNLVTLLARA